MLFARSFPVARLGDASLHPWFGDLLRHWAPAGTPLCPGDSPAHLRLAVRANHLNFYRSGQSMARVFFDQSGELVASIHHKYLDDAAQGQAYGKLRSAGYLSPAGVSIPYSPEVLASAIQRANAYGGEEKSFVDAVVSSNGDILDLEMALPGGSVAPRMDLVALEPTSGDAATFRVVFWEAKRVTDARARCRGDEAPEVVAQLRVYTDWLALGDNRATVAAAYQQACRILLALHAVAATAGIHLPPLGPAVVAVARPDAPPLHVDERPRLLIDDREMNGPFTTNGHLAKLLRMDVPVQMVRSPDDLRLGPLRQEHQGREKLPGPDLPA